MSGKCENHGGIYINIYHYLLYDNIVHLSIVILVIIFEYTCLS